MRTEVNIRAAIALLERAAKTFQYSREIRAALAGELVALRFVLREEPPGRGTLEELLANYASLFDGLDAKAATAIGEAP